MSKRTSILLSLYSSFVVYKSISRLSEEKTRLPPSFEKAWNFYNVIDLDLVLGQTLRRECNFILLEKKVESNPPSAIQ